MTQNQSKKTPLQWGEQLKKTLLASPYDEAQALECIKGWAEACRAEKINVNRFILSYNTVKEDVNHCSVEAMPQALLFLWFHDQKNPSLSAHKEVSVEQLKTLIKAIWSEGVQVNNTYPDTDQFQPDSVFHLATRLGIEEIAVECLRQGANIKVRDPQTDHTPLMAAVREGHLETVKALVDLGVDLNPKDRFGNTALMLAVIYRRQRIVDLLLEQGADVHCKNKKGQDALAFASGGLDSPKLMKSLLAFHQNINTRNPDIKVTACHEAAARGRLENLKCLVEAGAHLELKDKYGGTPLAIAIDRGHQYVINYLSEVINAQYEKKALERVLKKETQGIQNDPLKDPLDGRGPDGTTSSEQKNLKKAALGAPPNRRL